jgi:hypothetical protein
MLQFIFVTILPICAYSEHFHPRCQPIPNKRNQRQLKGRLGHVKFSLLWAFPFLLVSVLILVISRRTSGDSNQARHLVFRSRSPGKQESFCLEDTSPCKESLKVRPTGLFDISGKPFVDNRTPLLSNCKSGSCIGLLAITHLFLLLSHIAQVH